MSLNKESLLQLKDKIEYALRDLENSINNHQSEFIIERVKSHINNLMFGKNLHKTYAIDSISDYLNNHLLYQLDNADDLNYNLSDFINDHIVFDHKLVYYDQNYELFNSALYSDEYDLDTIDEYINLAFNDSSNLNTVDKINIFNHSMIERYISDILEELEANNITINNKDGILKFINNFEENYDVEISNDIKVELEKHNYLTI